MINIIREDSRINTELTAFPAANVNVAIFGTQSSGKSTLLNHVFATKFPVLNTEITRERCTKGIWFHNISNINVIDTQGFDSVERGQQERMFEKQVALFCLALSDVLIINLWMNQIGRYEASHSHILKAIIRASERVIASQQRKIIFVVRDCTDDADRSILKQELSTHMMGIIKAETQKSTLKFSLQFFMMSHLFENEKQFKKQAKLLLNQISTTKKSNLSNYSNEDRLVYVKNLWEKISSEDSDIDLRTIEDSLRAYVLQRIKKEAIFHMEDWIQKIQNLDELKTYQRYMQAAKRESQSFYIGNKPRHLKEKQVQAYVTAIDQSISIHLNKHFMSFLLPNQEDRIISKDYSEKMDSFEKTNSNDFRKKMAKLRRQVTEAYKNIIRGLREHAKMTRRFEQKIETQDRKYEQFIQHLENVFKVELQGSLNEEIDKQTKNLLFDESHLKKIISIMQEKHNGVASIYMHDIWDHVIQRTSKSTLVDRIKSQGEQYSTASFNFIMGSQDEEIVKTYRSLQKQAEKYLSELLKFNSTEQDLTLNLQKFEDIRKLINDLIDQKLIQQAKRFKITLVFMTVILFFFYSEFKIILNVLGLSKKRIKRWIGLYIIVMITSISILGYRNRQTIKSIYLKYIQS